jgi:hypothetical protein
VIRIQKRKQGKKEKKGKDSIDNINRKFFFDSNRITHREKKKRKKETSRKKKEGGRAKEKNNREKTLIGVQPFLRQIRPIPTNNFAKERK